jgi:hypothetical protein
VVLAQLRLALQLTPWRSYWHLLLLEHLEAWVALLGRVLLLLVWASMLRKQQQQAWLARVLVVLGCQAVE